MNRTLLVICFVSLLKVNATRSDPSKSRCEALVKGLEIQRLETKVENGFVIGRVFFPRSLGECSGKITFKAAFYSSARQTRGPAISLAVRSSSGAVLAPRKSSGGKRALGRAGGSILEDLLGLSSGRTLGKQTTESRSKSLVIALKIPIRELELNMHRGYARKIAHDRYSQFTLTISLQVLSKRSGELLRTCKFLAVIEVRDSAKPAVAQMFLSSDLCPSLCCRQKKCSVTTNFNIRADLLASGSLGSAVSQDNRLEKGKTANYRVVFLNSTDEPHSAQSSMKIDEKGEETLKTGPDSYVFFVNLYRRYTILMRVAYAAKNGQIYRLDLGSVRMRRKEVKKGEVLILSFTHIFDGEGYYLFYFKVCAKQGEKYYLVNSRNKVLFD